MNKVNEAHTMTKILTIEKMIKAKMEHDELQKKRESIFRIREDRHRPSVYNQYRTEKLRQMSYFDSKRLKEAINLEKSYTIDAKRSKADQVREEKQRHKDRQKRYEQFKINKAKKNYLDKMEELKETLDEKERKLDVLYREELKEERNFETT